MRAIFYILILYSVICFIGLPNVLAQQSKKSSLFDEFAVSLNLSTAVSNNVHSRLGFGLGAYHIFRKEKKINFIIGLEYNYIARFCNLGDFSHYSHYTNVTYRNHYLSLPFLTRFNWGDRTIFFIEPGIFIGLSVISQMKGDYSFAYPVSDTVYEHGTKKVNEYYGGNVNGGFSLGLGLKIPSKKVDFIIKTDYKFGLVGFLLNDNNLLGYARLSFAVGLRSKNE